MRDMIVQNPWIIWAVIGVAFLIVEACTTALVSLWFVAGALAAAITSLFTDSVTIQTAVFVTVSVVSLVLVRKLFKRDRKETLAQPEERLCGVIGVVTQEITPLGGQVCIKDVHWRATSDVPVAVGEPIIVKAVNGNTVTVECYQEKESVVL